MPDNKTDDKKKVDSSLNPAEPIVELVEHIFDKIIDLIQAPSKDLGESTIETCQRQFVGELKKDERAILIIDGNESGGSAGSIDSFKDGTKLSSFGGNGKAPILGPCKIEVHLTTANRKAHVRLQLN